MDTLFISRLQFGLNISFHIFFPTLTIALGWFLFFFKLKSKGSESSIWMKLYYLFTKVFAVSFALGVVSGITMSFQFGTNWPGFMNKVGNIAGPLLAYEVLTAFFLEASFLGVMLYGRGKVPEWVHTLATFLVALGTTFSAFWILVLNSWMHTPVGYELREGVAHATNWIEIVFNPSMPFRLLHMLLASGLTASFVIMGMGSFIVLKNFKSEAGKVAVKMGLFVALVLAPVQLVVGDLHGLITRQYQPAKLAAMEALWETQSKAPLVLFAFPDEGNQRNHAEIAIPGLSSFIITRDVNGVVQGLKDFEKRPPVAPVFWAFRLMVGSGLIMILTTVYFMVTYLRRTFGRIWHYRVLAALLPIGWVATLAGWYVTEIGRQPWLVQGVLLTRDAVTYQSSSDVSVTFIGFLTLYLFLFGAYFFAIRYFLSSFQEDLAHP